ncbi:uncharacterized protein LOC127263571 isoform X2 [Andrographis paniculata]|uniref:uncharacterized protein LOC127263571 isoform X2 n=1 Tax=Andrographis paniculata TaxID=175694 RepID=UPI0021E75B17|nr:uncharacterized protein LOC127263571 isoform X2 [Andrographis paniculata]
MRKKNKKMSGSTREICKPDTRGKAKGPSGWMDFDLKQRRKKQGLEAENDSDAYPVLSGTIAPNSLIKKNEVFVKNTISSPIVGPNDFPSLMDTENIGPKVSSKADYQKLNELCHIVDERLIEDILAGVNYNFDKAISLVEAMFNSEIKDVDIKEVESSRVDFQSFDAPENHLVENLDMGCITRVLPDYEASSALNLDSSKSLPIEPEWEEDDIYLAYRKDAIKSIRSASRQSKAANDAYIKGDHISARHYSCIAKEQWVMAKKLNAKAAKEIFAVRNCKNDLWTLDLHGLHALEAVEALRDRLRSVESLVLSSSFATLGGAHSGSSLFGASVPSANHVKMGTPVRYTPSTRPRQLHLQVITGKHCSQILGLSSHNLHSQEEEVGNGNHSRGAATLPSAVKNFLNENRYHYDETRAGVLMVHPKFRKQ